jgi:hypothetical protein
MATLLANPVPFLPVSLRTHEGERARDRGLTGNTILEIKSKQREIFWKQFGKTAEINPCYSLYGRLNP